MATQLLLAAVLACAQAPAAGPATPGPGAASIVAPGAKLETLWGDGAFTEGPVMAPDGAILFSDIGDRILRFDPRDNSVRPFRDPSGRANGLVLDGSGRLLAAEGANAGGNRRVSVTEADGTVRTLADRYRGKRFNSPNDLAVDPAGRVYLSDPRYVGDEPRELDDEAVYRVDPDGSVSRLETTATKPNGLAVSPDGRILYVADNGPKRRALLALPLDPATGSVGKPRVLKDFGTGRGIDGMTMTADGKVVAAAGGGILAGVYVYAPDGTPLAFLATPEVPSNVELAGPSGSTLYITAGKGLYRVETNLVGCRVGPKPGR